MTDCHAAKRLSESLCTCGDTECPFHPTQHELGCSLCIEKNLQRREIPSCFFHRHRSGELPDRYTFEDFARWVLCDQDASKNT